MKVFGSFLGIGMGWCGGFLREYSKRSLFVENRRDECGCIYMDKVE